MDFANFRNASDPKQGSSLPLVDFVHTAGTQQKLLNECAKECINVLFGYLDLLSLHSVQMTSEALPQNNPLVHHEKNAWHQLVGDINSMPIRHLFKAHRQLSDKIFRNIWTVKIIQNINQLWFLKSSISILRNQHLFWKFLKKQ